MANKRNTIAALLDLASLTSLCRFADAELAVIPLIFDTESIAGADISIDQRVLRRCAGIRILRGLRSSRVFHVSPLSLTVSLTLAG